MSNCSFGMSYTECGRVIKTWLFMIDMRMAAFGLLPTTKEYKCLVPSDFAEQVRGVFAVMWDTTDVRVNSPSDLETQRL